MIYVVVACMALWGLGLFVVAFMSVTDGNYAGALSNIGIAVTLLLTCWLLFKVLRGEGKDS